MKPKVNIDEVCGIFNTLRQENLHKKFSPDEIRNLMTKNGIGNAVFRRMAQLNFFRIRTDPGHGKGNMKQYAFTDTPIYLAQFKKVYEDVRASRRKQYAHEPSGMSEKLTEESAYKFLKSKGYQLRRCLGFDEEAFKKDYPQLWEKYLIYENV